MYLSSLVVGWNLIMGFLHFVFLFKDIDCEMALCDKRSS